MKPGPKPSSGKAMTHAERQARYRTKQAKACPAPLSQTRRSPQPRSEMARCRCGSTGAQNEYQAWLEALPENMADGATAEALRAICDLDLSELQSIVPPKGFGRN